METNIDTLQIKIKEARLLLSKESLRAIDDVNWKLIILGLDKKYKPEQLENLETETELLLCGLVDTEDYPKELENRMLLSKVEVVSLINDLDKLIFQPIQEKLEKNLTMKDVTKSTGPIKLDPKFENIPKEIQQEVAISDWKVKLYEIAKKYKLTIEQMGILEEVTTGIMQGRIHPGQYESELSSRTNISRENISNIIIDVNENIISKIRFSLEKHWEEKDKKLNEQVEDIPLPPYAPKPTTKTAIPSNINVTNKPAYHSAQLEIDAITPKNQSLESAEIDLEMPLEEPIKLRNIMEEKLNNVTTSDHTVTDYTMPKISSQSSNINQISSPEETPHHDPYREDFK